MQLLIIEDDRQLAQIMKQGLEREGWIVDVSNLGMEGEEKAFIHQYDAILLDLNLPDKDGIEILTFLRSENIQTPVVIISARDEIKQRALGLDVGADDYVTKPFDFLEVNARIRAVVRRFQGRANPIIMNKNLKIDPKAKRVTISGVEVLLSAKEYEILEFLAIKSPQIVTKEEISDQIYGEDADPQSSVLRVHIANLRKKTESVSGEKIIETIKGRGYRL
ncbi:quorum sensing DNA-binding response regulator in two-component regulatory system with QseC [Erysipelotrichaceae bacterium]|nr:quorum sensing DNA-binding response regulator in two-component regulatory system with QseC [Erysipelotrichaceae bacterium]